MPGAQALLRGLDVLLAIGAATHPPRFAQLEQTLGIPRATLHRLLAALISRQLIRHDERTRTYQVGLRVMEMSRRALDQSSLIRVAKPELARLARLLRWTVCLMVMEGDEVFVLDFEDPDTSQGRIVRLWPRLRAADSAAGRAFLAAMPRSDADRVVRSWDGAAGWLEEHRIEIGVAKSLGYAVVARDPVLGRPGVAAAVVDDRGQPVAAIVCLADSEHVPPEELHGAGRIVADGARRASGQMGTRAAPSRVWPRPAAPTGTGVDVLPTGRDFVGENPLWHEESGRVFWVDVLAPALRWYRPADATAGRIDLPRLTAGLAFDVRGRLIAAGEGGLFVVDPETGATRPLVNPEQDRPDNRFNTVGVDRSGRIWAGTMAINHELGRGSLYAIDAELRAIPHLPRVGMPKNVAFAPDGRRMYFVDAGENAVLSYSCDPATGALSDQSVFLPGGTEEVAQPNGITVDADGGVWVACLGSWRVRRCRPDGTLWQEVLLPVPMPTNCCFGGPGLGTLFVTSSFIRLPADLLRATPASGMLLAVQTDTRGQTPQRFGARIAP